MAAQYEYIVPADEQGTRADLFLAKVAPGLSRSQVKRLIEQGLASLNGSRIKPGLRLAAGQKICLTIPDPSPVELIPDPGVSFAIIYQDTEVIVLNKPPGLVVHPAAGHYHGTLVHGLLDACSDLAGIGGELRPGIVHRLDKDTSGIMVVAKTMNAHHSLIEQFKNRQVKKIYLGLCLGEPKTEQGRIDSPIGRHPVRRQEMSVRARSSKPALTRWKVLRRFKPGISLLEIEILTGRTHQIRVHLASIGLPILGDRVYGRGLGPVKEDSFLKNTVKRHMLHARAISFIHPSSNAPLTFQAEPFEDMALLIGTL